ncbi:PAS domain S-box protein [Poriferisphaera sp. WC338]|uniref:PAS domain S-box protein n=1 Tax=Poriferisphaera sp. WC338 TaxID=3425129 RepID=UPI003D8160F6
MREVSGKDNTIIDQEKEQLRERITQLEQQLASYKQQAELIPDFAKHFKGLVEYAPGVVYFCKNDPKYTMVYLNHAIERVTGYKREDFLDHGLTFAEIIHGDDLQRVRDHIQHALTKQKDYRMTYRVKHRDGSWRWVQEIGQGVNPNEDGEAVYLKGVIWDVTEGKEHEAKLEVRDAILNAVHFSVEQFLRTGDWEAGLGSVLERIGIATGVSYVFIFQNHFATEEDVQQNQSLGYKPGDKYAFDVGDLLFSQRFEWQSPAIPDDEAKPRCEMLPYVNSGFKRWEEVLSRGESIFSNVADLPESEREDLQTKGIKSIGAVPIFVGKKWWGFIGMDECGREREWSDTEIDLLRTVADTLGAGIVRQQHDIDLRHLNEDLEQRVLVRTAELQELSERFEHQARELDTIFEVSADHMYLIDPEGKIIKASESSLRTYGLTKEQLIGNHPVDVGFAEETIEQVYSKLRRVFAERKPMVGEVLMPTMHGDRYFSYSLAPMRDENGYVYAALAISRDVTERKLAEDRLKESEQRLQGLLDHAPASIYLKDKDGCYLFVNRVFEQRYNLKVSEIVGKKDSDLFSKHLSRHYRENDVEVMNERRAIEYEESAFVKGECRVNLSIKFPLFDARDHVAGVCGISADITDRKNAEQVWKLVRTAIDQIDESVVITDSRLDGEGPEIIYVNPAFEKMTGWKAKEIVGGNPRVLYGPRTDKTLLEKARKALREGQPFSGESVHYRKEGKAYVAEWHVTPVRDETGKVINFVSIQRDVSEQKQAEEMERRRRDELAHVARLSTMGEMASGLAHELNQPLAAISNYVFGCKKRVEMGTINQDGLIEALSHVGDQSQRAGEIIRRMRNFVRKRESHQNIVTVNEIVEDVLALCVAEIRQNGVTLMRELKAEMPPVGVDKIQIEQVVLNLVRNAIESMREVEMESRQITIKTSVYKQDPHLVLLEVQDAGEGLDEQTIKQIFNPFFSTKSDGMGMGLTISQSIVENHGGRLWAEGNQGGHGATFFMTLPIFKEFLEDIAP